jgi:hypothetical protein
VAIRLNEALSNEDEAAREHEDEARGRAHLARLLRSEPQTHPSERILLWP